MRKCPAPYGGEGNERTVRFRPFGKAAGGVLYDPAFIVSQSAFHCTKDTAAARRQDAAKQNRCPTGAASAGNPHRCADCFTRCLNGSFSKRQSYTARNPIRSKRLLHSCFWNQAHQSSARRPSTGTRSRLKAENVPASRWLRMSSISRL